MNIICASLVGAHFRGKPNDSFLIFIKTEHLFFYLMSVTFLIGTILIMTSCFASTQTAAILSNSIFEFIYHMTAAILYFCSSIAMLSVGAKWKDMNGINLNEQLILSAGAMGLINTALYSGSVFLVFRSV